MGHTSVVYDGKIWVIGGEASLTEVCDTAYRLNDVWYSTDGVEWTEATDSAAWPPRSNHTSVVHDGKIWVMGGTDGSTVGSPTYNDVWCSADGVVWTQVCEHAGWAGRFGHSSAAYDNRLWIMGGVHSGFYNDVWHSPDGAAWSRATGCAAWPARSDHSTVPFEGRLWLLGGRNHASYSSDVWYSEAAAVQPQDVDFCADMDAVVSMCQGMPPEPSYWLERWLLLACATADINGPLENDFPGPNGMLDGEFELGLVGRLINNPAIDLSSGMSEGQVAPGVKALDVEAAFGANTNTVLGFFVIITLLPQPLPDPMGPGGEPFRVLGAYATIGDDDSLGAIEQLLGPEVSIEGTAIEGLPDFLGPEGDADGDGFTNRQEYDAFAASGGPAGYIAAALDPMLVPGIPRPRVFGRSPVEAGGPLDLWSQMSVAVDDPAYQWSKDGAILDGEAGASLSIPHASVNHSGVYRVTVTDNSTKAVYVSDPFYVTVVPEGSLPVAGVSGLALMCVMAALAGARAIRSSRS